MKTNFKFLTATILFCILIVSGINAQVGNWLTSGNTGTSPDIHFLGTKDNKALVIRTNNIARIRITNTGKVGIGTANPSAILEVAGEDAIINGLTIGRGKGGDYASTATGFQTLFSNTSGINNSAFGWNVLYNNTVGFQNTGTGTFALYHNISGYSNTANGATALLSNTTGRDNTAIGAAALLFNTTGIYNTAAGDVALVNTTTGNYNIGIGSFTLGANTTGSLNTAVGINAFSSGAAFFNSTALGANAVITTSNQVSLGDSNVASLFCKGAYAATTAAAPNMYVNAAGQIMRSTAPAGTGWLLTGNAGTIAATNFIGTTDNVPFNIRVNNQKAGRIEIGLTANTFYGNEAGNSITTGNTNTGNGFRALYANTTGSLNIANGSYALASNTTGNFNTANGFNALGSNMTGSNNTANGALALAINTGLNNTATGAGALFANSTGIYNTADGVSALLSNLTGSLNTAFGANANVSTDGLFNATAIGFGAIVNDNNKVRIGDNNVTVVESAAGSWTVSDGRFKSNIKEEVKGLEFIRLLRPVVYNFDAGKFDAFLSQKYPDSIKNVRKEMMKKSTSKLSSIRQSGFIAQEMEIAAQKSGYQFNGVHTPENPTDNYSISYEKLVVPLVKAVQELSNKNDALKSENETLKTRLDKIEQAFAAKQTTFEDISSASIEQNVPNPYNANTIINYFVPLNAGNAVLKITDIKGVLLKTVTLKKGKGQVILQSDQLVPGTYQYSLFINGRLSGTRQMILIR